MNNERFVAVLGNLKPSGMWLSHSLMSPPPNPARFVLHMASDCKKFLSTFEGYEKQLHITMVCYSISDGNVALM